VPTYGNANSTLNQELNRLANGGTYRLNPQMVDMALAARQWAAARGVTTYHTDTVGVLNDIAGNTGPALNHLDFSGVCNKLAGTSGLTAAAALREIES
jgi:hypothetical protein